MVGARAITDAEFPGYREAVARENKIRAVACLNLTEVVCGLEVLPLTPYHLRFLALVNSPFLFDGVSAADLKEKPGIVEDVFAFLWIVSPLFSPVRARVKRRWWQRRNAREQFNEAAAQIIKMDAVQVCQEILDYVQDAFIDYERGKGGSGHSYFHEEVAFAQELHTAYAHQFRIDFWRDEPRATNPSHVPLKLLFQLRKVRKQYEAPDAILTNHSDVVLSEGLTEINRRN